VCEVMDATSWGAMFSATSIVVMASA
jgi:hypothetical protein